MFNLKWKILISILLLIALVCIGIFLPIYWQTRISIEDQLQNHFIEQLYLISSDINIEELSYKTNNRINKTTSNLFQEKIEIISAESLFMFNNDGLILAFSGNGSNATKSLMLHKYMIKDKTQNIFKTPVFEASDNLFLLSVFIRINNEYLLGISANADYLKNLADLRNQMVLLTLLILFITSIIAILFSSSLTKPLQKLTVFANQIGHGRPEHLNYAKRKDEIGILYKTMIEMQEKIQKREKENKQIVATVAHELRNPIAGMQVNIELLMEELDKDDDSYKFSQLTHNDILKLVEIVDSFLNYSRPINSNLEVHDIKDIFEEILTTNHFEEIRDRFYIAGNAASKVHRNKIKHAFSNLMQNAIDASIDKINITILEKNDYVKITIENLCEPIIDKSQIFEAFYSTKENGVGLGLPISKSIVEQHGGEIFLEKSDDTGTLFVITLPALKNK